MDFKILFVVMNAVWCTNAFTICDCNAAHTKGIIDMSVPDYCDHKEEYTHDKPKIVTYELVSKTKPPFEWDGYICEMYIKQLIIVGSFWAFSYDTQRRQYTIGVTLDDCKMMVHKKLCNGNKVEESNGVLKYEAEATGSGYWMQRSSYKAVNCVAHRITLRQEEIDGDIDSPIGLLPGAKYDDGNFYINRKTIIWEKTNRTRDEWESCRPTDLIKARGSLTHTGKQGRIVDVPHQLEILFNTTKEKYCTEQKDGKTIEFVGHSVLGLQGAYVQMSEEIETGLIASTEDEHRRKRETGSIQRAVIFDDKREEEGEMIDVQRVVWTDSLRKLYSEYLKAVESYKHVQLYGNIRLRSKPEWILTVGSPQEPVYLDTVYEEGDKPIAQNFKLENNKLMENISYDDGPMCLSVMGGRKDEPELRLYTCNRENLSEVPPEWNVPDAPTSQWAYDIDDGMLIETHSSRCLTNILGTNKVTVKQCERPPNPQTQLWSFEFFGMDVKFDPIIKNKLFLRNDDDVAPTEESVEFSRNKDQLLVVNNNSLAHGRIGLYTDDIRLNKSDLWECVSIRYHDQRAMVGSCVDKSYLDYYKPNLGQFQDFEHMSDYTIRRTASNQCLDVLLTKKRASRKYLFPSYKESEDNSTWNDDLSDQDRTIFNSDNRHVPAEEANENTYQDQSLVLQHCKTGSSRFIYDWETNQFVIFELKEGLIGCLSKRGRYLMMDKCRDTDVNQKWVIDNFVKQHVGKLNVKEIKSIGISKVLDKMTQEERENLTAVVHVLKQFKEIHTTTEQAVTESSFRNLESMSLTDGANSGGNKQTPLTEKTTTTTTAKPHSSQVTHSTKAPVALAPNNQQTTTSTTKSPMASTKQPTMPHSAQQAIQQPIVPPVGGSGVQSSMGKESKPIEKQPSVPPMNQQVVPKPIEGADHKGKDHKSDTKEEETEDFKLIMKKIVSSSDGSSTGEISVRNLSNFVKSQVSALHHQYLIDRQTDHSNVLSDELRQVYCQVSKMKRNQLMLTAQLSPILAARSMNMQPCERVSGRGESLLLQECKSITKEIGAFQSNCNFQPVFEHDGFNWSLAADGWSPVRITGDQNDFCFWRDGNYININGGTYYWKHDTVNPLKGNWELQKPTIHQSQLSLVKRFKLKPVNDYNYRLLGHSFHGQMEVEHLTILMELAARAQQYQSSSAEAITTDEKRESIASNLFGWLKTLRIIVFCIIGFIIFAVCLRIFLIFNPIPVIGKIIEESSDDIKDRKSKRKNKDKKNKKGDKGIEVVEPIYNEVVMASAPPVYASLVAAAGLSSVNSKPVADASIKMEERSKVKIRHSHNKCRFVKGLGLVWEDNCMCGAENK